MAADYAGALGAIKQYFVDAWVSGGSPLTPVGFVNQDEPKNSIPVEPSNPDGEQTLIPWVLFEVLHSGSYIAGSGTPGAQTIVYDGLIKGHVFVPVNSGIEFGMGKAVAVGEVFRNKLFYNDVTPGCFVRTGYDIRDQPRIDQGDASSDDGRWFAVTATIPFEYWHRG